MNYKAHIISGFIFVAIFTVLNYYFLFVSIPLNLKFLALSSVLIMFYSLLPDIDKRDSKIFAFITGLLLMSTLFAIYLKEYTLSISLVIVLFVIFILPNVSGFGHRGRFHSILMGLILTAPVLFLSRPLFIVAFIAFFSHLLMDKCIKMW